MGGDWRDRLREAVEADGHAMRVISLKAGVSHGYLQSLLKTTKGKKPKEPRIEHLVAIIDAMPKASLLYILKGVPGDAELEKFSEALGPLNKAERDALLRHILEWGKLHR